MLKNVLNVSILQIYDIFFNLEYHSLPPKKQNHIFFLKKQSKKDHVNIFDKVKAEKSSNVISITKTLLMGKTNTKSNLISFFGSYLCCWVCNRVITKLILMSCEDALGPRPLLYAGALAEGITETKTNSLSSQPPQNRNTPSSKREGQQERVGGEREARSQEIISDLQIFPLSGVDRSYFLLRLIITPTMLTINHIFPP